jgi:diguanylate cyclase (GGDEF)-like protein
MPLALNTCVAAVFASVVLLADSTFREASPSFGVLTIDIDHLKLLNDSFGHHAGDIALREVARIMTDRVRDGDTICRYGGRSSRFLSSRRNPEDSDC